MLPGPLPRLPEPTLFAVLRGFACLTVDDTPWRVDAGNALWVPAGTAIRVEPQVRAVVLPVPALATGPAGPTRVRVGPAHVPGLLHEFACTLGHLDGAQSAAVEVRTVGAARLAPPPAPRSHELKDLADLLTDDPDLNIADAVAAAIAGWSVRTVQRRFVSETGITLGTWVRRARVSAAAELLARGRDIEWVAHRVGYRSVAGFTRGFAEVAGLPPGQWRRTAHTPAEGTAELRVPGSWERRTHRTWSRINGAHIAVWAADGPSQITAGSVSLTLRQGEAAILPAGIPNRVLIPPGSILLPIGFRPGSSGPIGAPVAPANLGGLDALDTVESMLAAYTPGNTAHVDPDRGFAAALSGSQRHPTDAHDAVLAALASLVSRSPETAAPAAASSLGVTEEELHRIVRTRSGESFMAWQRRSRMTRARTRLSTGETVSEVSRTLGYAHLPAFSRAFRAVHGTGPSALSTRDTRPGVPAVPVPSGHPAHR